MARLTEQEKQDIIRYLEADKPLPDRFYLQQVGEWDAVQNIQTGTLRTLC